MMNDTTTSDDYDDELTPEQQAMLKMAGGIMSGFSISGSILNLVLILILKRFRDVQQVIVMAICISDILFGSVVILNIKLTITKIFQCRILCFFEATGFLSSMMWTCCFAHSLMKSLDKENRMISRKRTMIYIFYGIVLPIIGALMLANVRNYAVDNETCWIDAPDFNWVDLLGYNLICLGSVIYCGICYYRINNRIKRVSGENNIGLAIIPLVLVICALPLTVYDLYMNTYSGGAIFWWLFIAYILWNSQGFLNAFAYGLSSRIKNQVKTVCFKGRKLSEAPPSTQFQESLLFGEERIARMSFDSITAESTHLPNT